jgi:hypothetical protein
MGKHLSLILILVEMNHIPTLGMLIMTHTLIWRNLIKDVIAKTTRYMDEYSELVRRAGGEQWTIIHQITEIVVEA